MAPHTGSATPDQIDNLLNFLDEHRDLAGKLMGGDGNARAKRLWEEVCNMLNSMGGCTKTVQQWQKVWFDRKHLAKKAATDARRSASATGGGPSTALPLTQWQLKILSIMGDGFGERQTGARVQVQMFKCFYFNEINEPMPSTSQSVNDIMEFEVVERDEPSQEDRQAEPSPEDRQAEPTSRQSVSQESQSSTLSSRSIHSRRRQSAAGSDVRSRLFRYEDGRVDRETVRNTLLANIHTDLASLLTSIHTELAGIKTALLQMCEHLEHRNDNNN